MSERLLPASDYHSAPPALGAACKPISHLTFTESLVDMGSRPTGVKAPESRAFMTRQVLLQINV